VCALDQVVVSRELQVAGDGLVITQEIDGVQVAVKQMPLAVAEGLGDTVSESPGGCSSESCLLE